MAEDEITLIEPTETLREAYLGFAEEFRAAGEDEIQGTGGMDVENFAESIQRLRSCAEGITLSEDGVPASTYWLVRGDRVLGTCNLRHRLNESLRDHGGHVGYSVRPSERRKGYGVLMLKLVLEKARRLGIRRALLTCGKENVASARVIRKNGGVLDSESHSPRAGLVMQRFWIELSA